MFYLLEVSQANPSYCSLSGTSTGVLNTKKESWESPGEMTSTRYLAKTKTSRLAEEQMRCGLGFLFCRPFSETNLARTKSTVKSRVLYY